MQWSCHSMVKIQNTNVNDTSLLQTLTTVSTSILQNWELHHISENTKLWKCRINTVHAYFCCIFRKLRNVIKNRHGVFLSTKTVSTKIGMDCSGPKIKDLNKNDCSTKHQVFFPTIFTRDWKGYHQVMLTISNAWFNT